MSNSKVGKPQKMALFRDIGPGPLNGYESPMGEHMEGSSSYVRISEYVEIVFPQLKDEIVIDKYIAALDRSEREIRLEFQKKLDDIANQRANLLALAYFPGQASKD